MKADELKQLRELYASATPGEWEQGKALSHIVYAPKRLADSYSTIHVAVCGESMRSSELCVEDARLIAALHNAATDLFAAAEENVRLKAENAELRADFDDRDAEPDLLSDCVQRLKEALDSQSGMSLPEDFEHAMNAIKELKAENAELRQRLAVAERVTRDPEAVATAAINEYWENADGEEAARAAGGEAGK